MATFKFNLLSTSQVNDLPEGIEIIRSVYVKDIILTSNPSFSLTDPNALTKIVSDANCPPRFSSDPDPYYAGKGVSLRGFRLRNAGGDPTKAMLDLVYRGPAVTSGGSPGQNTFTLTDSTRTIIEQTFSTAGNARNIFVWYKAGSANSGNAAPALSVQAGVPARRRRSVRVLRATGTMVGSAWFAMADSVYSAASAINSVQWGSNASYTRGTWYFDGPTTRTADFGQTFFVQLDFLHDQVGFFDTVKYIEPIHHIHPFDCDTEATLAGDGLPAMGDSIHRNGLTKVSVQNELDFNTIFNFQPI